MSMSVYPRAYLNVCVCEHVCVQTLYTMHTCERLHVHLLVLLLQN
jgi:hypothetical protein